MTIWTERLDDIRRGIQEDSPAVFVRTLKLPPIAGWEPHHVWLDWQVDPALFHPGEAVFGGYIAALADYVLAFPVWTFLQDSEGITTSNLQLSFFRPARAGMLHIDARIVNRARTMVHVEASFTQSDKLVAVANATQIIVSNVE